MLGGWVAILAIPATELGSALGLLLARAATVPVLRLLTLALAQALDLVTFLLMIDRHGLEAEANPFVTDLFTTHGLQAVVVAKFALIVAIGALSVAAFANGRVGAWRMIGGLPLALAITAGLVGGITNAAVILS